MLVKITFEVFECNSSCSVVFKKMNFPPVTSVILKSKISFVILKNLLCNFGKKHEPIIPSVRQNIDKN